MDLSIIIPTYKPGAYIKEALSSLDKQLAHNFTVEIIVVLNGEKEPFFNILKNIQLSIQFKILYTEKAGVSNARNLGIENSTGKFILFLDDDDLLSENYISNLLSSAIKEDTVYVSNILCFKEGENEYYKDYIGDFIENKFYEKPTGNEFRVINYAKLMSSSCFKLIPKKVIEQKRFNTNLRISEDALFMFEISKNIKKIKICKDAFYYRRVRKNSALEVEKKNIMHVRNYFNFIYLLTVVYLKDFFNLSALFYLNRIMASTKFMCNNIYR